MATSESLQAPPRGDVLYNSLREPPAHGFPTVPVLVLALAYALGAGGWHWLYLLLPFWALAHAERVRLTRLWGRLRHVATDQAAAPIRSGTEPVAWLNHLLRAIWPVYERGLAEWVLSKLAKNLGDSGKVMGVGGLSLGEVKLKDLQLGLPLEHDTLAPLVLQNIHTVERTEERAADGTPAGVRLVMQVDVRFSTAHASTHPAHAAALSMEMSGPIPGIGLEVGIRNITLEGTLRLELAWVRPYPWLGTLSVSFAAEPSLQFDVYLELGASLGANLTDLSSQLKLWLTDKFKEAMRESLVVPERFSVPLYAWCGQIPPQRTRTHTRAHTHTHTYTAAAAAATSAAAAAHTHAHPYHRYGERPAAAFAAAFASAIARHASADEALDAAYATAERFSVEPAPLSGQLQRSAAAAEEASKRSADKVCPGRRRGGRGGEVREGGWEGGRGGREEREEGGRREGGGREEGGRERQHRESPRGGGVGGGERAFTPDAQVWLDHIKETSLEADVDVPRLARKQREAAVKLRRSRGRPSGGSDSGSSSSRTSQPVRADARPPLRMAAEAAAASTVGGAAPQRVMGEVARIVSAAEFFRDEGDVIRRVRGATSPIHSTTPSPPLIPLVLLITRPMQATSAPRSLTALGAPLPPPATSFRAMSSPKRTVGAGGTNTGVLLSGTRLPRGRMEPPTPSSS